jgi:hypothetical protein
MSIMICNVFMIPFGHGTSEQAKQASVFGLLYLFLRLRFDTFYVLIGKGDIYHKL